MSDTQPAAGSAFLHEAAFEAQFIEHYPRVYALLYRLVGDRAAAEDLALEAFWRLWQHAPSAVENLGGWLYRVAVRLGYNALRAEQRRAQYEARAGRDLLEQNPAPNPADEVEQAEERRRVRAVLAQMPEREAQLLVLRSAGHTYREIALALHLAPNSVGTLLTRAEEIFERLYRKGE